MKSKKKKITSADLKFKHFELAKRLSKTLLEEMMKEQLGKNEIPEVLSDLCKFVVLCEAVVSEEGALLVVDRFTALSTDLTCLMMRIIQDKIEGLQ